MSQSTDSWTIKRLLEWTTDFLQRSGAASPRLDAEVLLAQARGCKRLELYTAFDQEVSEAARAQFREHVKRRAEGMPVAYLVGKREFYSLEFQVTPDVLIPRPETEHLVVALVEALQGNPQPAPQIADVGTGSGILAVCAAKLFPNARVTASDISPAALAVARENARRHGVDERIEFLEGDLLAPVAAGTRFDFILSNPPYVAESELAELGRDVREFEPHLALVAGPQGTEVIARLVPQAAARLQPGGWLIFELGPAIAPAALEIVRQAGAFDPVSLHKDLAGKPRYIQARRTT